VQGADLTPMIDVVFLLLVFFMVATNFVEETQQFDVELPKAEEAETVKVEQTLSIIVHDFDETVDPEERIVFRVNQVKSKRDQLFKDIKKVIEGETEIKTVVIKADKDARYQDIISVISCLNALEVEHFNLAVMGN
jgi:biopolymer transport protein ExbD